MSILLPTKNAGPRLDAVLRSVFSQRAPCAFEVVAVDSGSTDETLAILSRYPVRVAHIRPEEFNHGGTRNLLASLSWGDVLVYLTQDAVPADELWLANLITPLVREGVAGTYARQVPRPDTDPVNRFFLEAIYPDRSRVQALREEGLRVEDLHFSNASSAIRRDAWDAIPFRGDIIMAEDQDWSRRALEHGFTIRYVAEARVEHAHHYALKEVFRRYFDSGVSFRQIVGAKGATSQFSRQLARNGFRHVGDQIRFLWRERHARWIPHALLEDAAKALAIFLGMNHRWIPLRLKVRLSYHGAYWRRQAGAPPLVARFWMRVGRGT